MKFIVDTNVSIVANEKTEQASPECVQKYVLQLRDIQQNHTLVIDDGWHILREYMNNLRSAGQPGVGDAFLRWVLINQANPARCEQIHIMAHASEPNNFAEFPTGPDLFTFDLSDRKFVAVALSHPESPPILNATDTDW